MMSPYDSIEIFKELFVQFNKSPQSNLSNYLCAQSSQFTKQKQKETLIKEYPMKNQKINSVLFAIIIVVLTIILNMKP